MCVPAYPQSVSGMTGSVMLIIVTWVTSQAGDP